MDRFLFAVLRLEGFRPPLLGHLNISHSVSALKRCRIEVVCHKARWPKSTRPSHQAPFHQSHIPLRTRYTILTQPVEISLGLVAGRIGLGGMFSDRGPFMD